MKENIFRVLLNDYSWHRHALIVGLAIVMFACLRKLILTKWNRVAAFVVVTGFAASADWALRGWLESLGAIVAGYKTRKGHFFDDFSRYVDRVEVFLGAPEHAIEPVIFYAFIAAFLVTVAFTTRVLVESKSTRVLVYFGLFLVLAGVTLGVALPPAIFLALVIANNPQAKKKLVQGSEIINEGSLGALKLRSKLASDGELGAHLHPKVRIPIHMESTHILLLGASGSGKTTTLYPFVEEIYERGDRVVLYDLKKDFSAAFLGRQGVDVLSPFDERGIPWNVAADIKTQMQADEFAKMLCPENPDNSKQFFTLAARDIIAACVIKLQVEKEGRWNFPDLYALVSSSKEMRNACEKYRKAALQTVKDNGGDQSAGVIGEVRNRTRLIEYLAKAWPESEHGFSISKWVRESAPQKRMIIVQANTKYSELDKFFTTQIFYYLFKEVLSLEDSNTRRIWAIIDELPRLPAIPELTEVLSTGRSKGLCLVAAMQDFGRIKELYKSQGGIESIANGFAIKLVGRLESPEAAEYASRICGTNRYERTTVTRLKRKGGIDLSEQEQEVDKRALTDSFFRTLPKASLKVPAEFYFVSSGYPIEKLTYKIRPLPQRVKGNVEPAWMSRKPSEEQWDDKVTGPGFNFSTEEI